MVPVMRAPHVVGNHPSGRERLAMVQVLENPDVSRLHVSIDLALARCISGLHFVSHTGHFPAFETFARKRLRLH